MCYRVLRLEKGLRLNCNAVVKPLQWSTVTATIDMYHSKKRDATVKHPSEERAIELWFLRRSEVFPKRQTFLEIDN